MSKLEFLEQMKSLLEDEPLTPEEVKRECDRLAEHDPKMAELCLCAGELQIAIVNYVRDTYGKDVSTTELT